MVSARNTLTSEIFDTFETITVYQNHVKEFITNKFDTNLRIEIYTNLSQQVVTKKTDPNEKTISLDSLKAGIYAVKIK